MKIVKVHYTCIRGAIKNEWRIAGPLFMSLRTWTHKEDAVLMLRFLVQAIVCTATAGRYITTSTSDLKWFQGYEDLDESYVPMHKMRR